MSAAPPILVTGAHRSGTTWVGKMLALAPGVAYLHEPFNPRFSAGRFDRYFIVVTSENEDRYAPELERVLELRYDLAARLRTRRRPSAPESAVSDLNRLKQTRNTASRRLPGPLLAPLVTATSSSPSKSLVFSRRPRSVG